MVFYPLINSSKGSPKQVLKINLHPNIAWQTEKSQHIFTSSSSRYKNAKKQICVYKTEEKIPCVWVVISWSRADKGKIQRNIFCLELISCTAFSRRLQNSKGFTYFSLSWKPKNFSRPLTFYFFLCLHH